MITDVPTAEELHNTAAGWISLAWEIVLQTLKEFELFEENVQAVDEEYIDKEELETQRKAYWHNRRFMLNNAISLLQQSIELFLKAKIVETSPFLLIADDPLRWPKIDAKGQVSFSEFRTIDASQLCRAAVIAGQCPPAPSSAGQAHPPPCLDRCAPANAVLRTADRESLNALRQPADHQGCHARAEGGDRARVHGHPGARAPQEALLTRDQPPNASSC